MNLFRQKEYSSGKRRLKEAPSHWSCQSKQVAPSPTEITAISLNWLSNFRESRHQKEPFGLLSELGNLLLENKVFQINWIQGRLTLLKNLCKFFRKRHSFWSLRSWTPNPPSVLGKVTKGQAALNGFLLLGSEPLHKQCLWNLSMCLITVFGRR